MLLNRYSDITYIMDMDLLDGISFIQEGFKKEAEDYLHKQWLVELPNMDKTNFINFSDYKKKAFKTISKKKTKIEKEEDIKKIIEEAEKIKKLDQK